ncbi:hypothetical protein [Microbacterium sp. Ag1]|uniref:hypothetical protein n=1 Tax=Microbacterium sp. Ag1 TaxID=1643443 RepID=UPI0006296F60|nr:hypothetical protein [Microbacterium sp. Ag1]KKX96693.1 hypothetical protein AAY78_15350 [Microbacterium sp. Ag1]
MFSDIAGVRAALKERLAPDLPVRWSIEENLKQPPTEYRAPLITFEFTRFEAAPDGQELGAGQVGAAVDLVLGSPMTADEKGEDDVDQLALTLVQVLDRQSDMYWSTAEKQRLESGQWVWRIHTIVLTESKE